MSADLIRRLADELESARPHYCWSTNRDTCINEDCARRRALIAEARAATPSPEGGDGGGGEGRG